MTDAPAPPTMPPPPPVRVDATDRSPLATTLTTHLWAAPPLRRGEPLHDPAFASLRALKADLVRFLPWFTHPRISVPELSPPTATGTSWDFTELDAYVEDFMAAAEGRPVVANFATIPAWMFSDAVAEVSEDPDHVHWDYEQGRVLRDETLAEVADHFYRIASWYIAGGFTDELGVRHESGHRYRFAYWEILCEPDLNRRMSAQTYTRLYDAVVERLRPLDPEMRFIGLSLSHLHRDPEHLWYFLDPAHHAPGVPLDAISLHFYAQPTIVNPFGPEGNDDPATWRSTFFAQVEAFAERITMVQSMIRRLSPTTKLFLNEVGSYPADIMNPEPDIPEWYWPLGAAVDSAVWIHAARSGAELVGVAEFVDYPGMIPGTSLLDWRTGAPNARYHGLRVLLEAASPGDDLLRTEVGMEGWPDHRVLAQAVRRRDGTTVLVLVNTWDAAVPLDLGQQAVGGSVETVDTASPHGAVSRIEGPVLTLAPFATAVVRLPEGAAFS